MAKYIFKKITQLSKRCISLASILWDLTAKGDPNCLTGPFSAVHNVSDTLRTADTCLTADQEVASSLIRSDPILS